MFLAHRKEGAAELAYCQYMRFFLLFALVILAMPLAYANGFAGVWTAAVCPQGLKAEAGKCSQFVLELFEKKNKLCGSHLFATPSASLMDEGATPSVSGNVEDEAAVVSVLSSRSKVPGGVQAELKLSRGMLLWKRLDKPGRDELLPATAQFTRSRHKTLMAPVFAQQLAAACSQVDIPPSPHPQPEHKPANEPPSRN